MNLCILGASGFVGGRALRRAGGDARVLLHRRAVTAASVVEGDAGDSAVLERLLAEGATVLNFAYEAGRAEALGEALGAACAMRGVRRLVHVSTASVYGAAPGKVVDEETPCAPLTPYEREKHAVEQILERHASGRFELVVLRPTAVFGPGGRNLETLALRVLRQPWPRRYIRACLMGRRRLHAVDVECVAAAALFLADATLSAPAERFLVSQDDDPANHYTAVEHFFTERFRAKAYPLPPIALPAGMLALALRAAGRSNVDPYRCYSAAKLARRGFAAPRPLAAGLEEYARWIGQQHARP
jgi:nucleoside-diphosphate-sugar epimerase